MKTFFSFILGAIFSMVVIGITTTKMIGKITNHYACNMSIENVKTIDQNYQNILK